jgi:tetratricopeptide (TPR) repeat protein
VFSFPKPILRLAVGLSFSVLGGCASYQTKVKDFRNDLRTGRPEEAANNVKEKAWKDSDDQVVYLLEYATAQQLAKNYEESNKAYLRAEDLTDIKDYHSISRITGSLLLSQGMIQYKGDNYEKVLINAMLAINYLMEHRLDDAMVEARKLNDKLYKFRYEGKKNYDQNPFAFYLDALIEEDEKDYDSAYIDYKKVYDLNPRLPYLQEDLIRAGIAAQRMDEVAGWRQKFPGVKPADFKQVGEVILVFQQGWGPQKRPNPAFPRVPKLYPLFSSSTYARLEIEGGSAENTQQVMSVTDVAIKTLDEDYAGLIGMRAAGIATKAVVADQIRQKNELLGAIAWIGMNAADQADLRQWSSLPSSFQVAKLRLRPGSYKVRAVGLSPSGGPTGEVSEWWDVKVEPHKKVFLNWRSLR